MARGRMLDQRFATSSRLRALRRDDRLIYATLMPFVDREGRHNAEPYVLMATIFRLTDFTIDEVVNGIARLNAVGLIHLYADSDNAAILQVTRFHDFNKPNHREAASSFTAPENGSPVRDDTLIRAMVQALSDYPGGLPGEPPGDAPGASPGEAPGGAPYNGTERNGSRGADQPAAPSAEPTPQAAPANGAPRPKGRGPSKSVAEYMARRQPREKTPAELELEAIRARKAAAA